MDPITTAAIISAGAGLAGAGASAISSGKMNRRAVKYNKWALAQQQDFQADQAQIGRDWQAEQLAKANEWSLEQWNRENEYNLPSNQKSRLLAAGINPALAMQGDGNLGMASSAPTSQSPGSSPVASGSAAPSLSQYAPNLTAGFAQVSSAIDSYFQNAKTATETKGLGIQNLLTERYGERASQLSLGKTEAEINSLRGSAARDFAQASLTGLDASARRIMNKYLDAGQQLNLMTMLGQLATMQSERELNSARTRQSLAQEILTMAQANGQYISNRVANSLAESTIRAGIARNNYEFEDSAAAAHFAFDMRDMMHQQMSYDLGYSEVRNALQEFESYVSNTKGNRWIRKNLDPAFHILDSLAGAAGNIFISKGIGKGLGALGRRSRSRSSEPDWLSHSWIE
jgi:hypothetical protein